tara:strand:- start:4268 stop:4987 length:720 start_codon:yes stop_codon:yes gene_type:complete
MRTKCTTQNNAIEITKPVECPAVVTTPTTCTDPLTYLWNMASTSAANTGTAFNTSLDALLDAGLVISKSDNICCPTCTTAPMWSLSSLTPFLTTATTLGWTAAVNNPKIGYCCINTELSVANYTTYVNAMRIGGVIPTCCDTDFGSCFKELTGLVETTASLITSGVVETNTLGSKTSLCNLIQLIKNTRNITGTKEAFVNALLTKGIVVYCCDCNMIISSSAKFVEYVGSGACPDFGVF